MATRSPKYKSAEIAEYLETREGADSDAATRAGRAIADAWNDREFWASATRRPLEKCVATSPDMPLAADVLDRLVRRFGTTVHDVPDWESPIPKPAPARIAERKAA
jgi:hypothetical protein